VSDPRPSTEVPLSSAAAQDGSRRERHRTLSEDDTFCHLEAMTGLEEVELFPCPNVTAEGLARLRKALPGCTIQRISLSR